MTDNELLVQLLAEVKGIKSDLLKVKTSVDHDIPKKLDLLMSQHGDIIAAQKVTVDYPETKGRVAILERVAETHTQEIRGLKDKIVG